MNVLISIFILLYGIFKLFIIPFNNYNIINLIFWTILGLISFLSIGSLKIRNRTKIDSIQIILIVTTIYIIINYLLGLILGFSYNNFNIINSLINMCLIILIEITRYVFIINNKKKILLVIILFTFIEVINPIYSFKGLITILQIISILIKNILLTYISSYVGCIPPIIYNLIINLYLELPIIPNIGSYTKEIFNIIIMITLFIILRKLYLNNQNNKILRKKKSISLFIVLLILIPILSLTFGIGKYKVLGIVSNSMKPTFSRGTLVIYKKINENYNPDINQILIYEVNDEYIVHRIIKKDNNLLITKGDNNEVEDYPVSPNQYIGVVKIYIPFIGYPYVWVNELLSK